MSARRPTYRSWFSGIGCFDLALDRAGYRCLSSCEIDPFPRKVYATRFGRKVTFADIGKVDPHDLEEEPGDLWIGGFPCQDVSSAGKRAGINTQRTGLIWTLLDLWDRTPGVEWLLLENVPGLLWGVGESPEDLAWMGVLLGALADRGLRFAWRVLDARFFGVPQRRRRVFILARRAGNGSHPAEVLLEPEGRRGDPPARREARPGLAPGPQGGPREPRLGRGHRGGALADTVAGTIDAQDGGPDENDARNGRLTFGFYAAQGTQGAGDGTDVAPPLKVGSGGGGRSAVAHDVAGTLLGASSRAGYRLGADEAAAGHLVTGDLAFAVPAREARGVSAGFATTTLVASALTASGGHHGRSSPRGDGQDNLVVADVAPTVGAGGSQLEVREDSVANALRVGSGGSGSHHWVGVPAPDPVAFDAAQITHPENRAACRPGDPASSLAATGQPMVAYAIHADAGRSGEAATPSPDAEGKVRLRDPGLGLKEGESFAVNASHPHAVAYLDSWSMHNSGSPNQSPVKTDGLSDALNTTSPGGVAQETPAGMAVRRLTARECERLQGLPDDWTLIEGATDGARYKAIGNGGAVPVVLWIGERLARVIRGER